MKRELVGSGWTFPPRIGAQGGVQLTSDRNEISEAIHIILTTSPGQRVMRPTFGCRIHELVFAPNNVATAATAKRYVEEALLMWEPRIDNIEISARPDETNREHLVIEVKYRIKNTGDERSLVYPFYLIPEEVI